MNAQQLEADSIRERAELQDTLGELKRRLTPGQLVDEVLAYTKDGGGEFLANFGKQASANPIPVTLIGAGLAWFLMAKNGGANNFQSAGQDAGQSTDIYARDSAGMGDMAYKASGALSRTAEAVSDKAQEWSDSAQQGIAEAKSSLRSGVQSATATVRETADEVSRKAQSVAQDARATMDQSLAFLKDQPLVLMGVGLALGAAIGAALPTTETEQELMGEASADFKATVRDQAQEQFQQVKSAGKEFLDDLKEGAEENLPATAGDGSYQPSQLH